MIKHCACCGNSFEPRPQVPNQAFYSAHDCQRARKRQWQRAKLQSDSDYRINQRAARQAWAQRNQDDWRNYREVRPDYTQRKKSTPSSAPRKRWQRQQRTVSKNFCAFVDAVVRVFTGLHVYDAIGSSDFLLQPAGKLHATCVKSRPVPIVPQVVTISRVSYGGVQRHFPIPEL